MIELNKRQIEAVEAAEIGFNFFLTGFAGTGKTRVISEIMKRCSSKHIALTATTGIAASLIGGTTINSWSGIGVLREEDDIGDMVNRILWKQNIVTKIGRAHV